MIITRGLGKIDLEVQEISFTEPVSAMIIERETVVATIEELDDILHPMYEMDILEGSSDG